MGESRRIGDRHGGLALLKHGTPSGPEGRETRRGTRSLLAPTRLGPSSGYGLDPVLTFERWQWHWPARRRITAGETQLRSIGSMTDMEEARTHALNAM